MITKEEAITIAQINRERQIAEQIESLNQTIDKNIRSSAEVGNRKTVINVKDYLQHTINKARQIWTDKGFTVNYITSPIKVSNDQSLITYSASEPYLTIEW